MSDSAAFVMTISIVAVGGLLYTAIYRLAEIIKDKNFVRINNFGIKRSEMDELVRCKDCKHGQYEEWDNGECVDKTVYCDGYGIHKPDWFCADGKQKD